MWLRAGGANKRYYHIMNENVMMEYLKLLQLCFYINGKCDFAVYDILRVNQYERNIIIFSICRLTDIA